MFWINQIFSQTLTVAPRSAENRFREAEEVAWEPRPQGSGVEAIPATFIRTFVRPALMTNTLESRLQVGQKTAYWRARLGILKCVTERLTRTGVRGKPSTNGKRFRGARVSKRFLTVAPRSAANRFREAGEVAWEPRPQGSGVQPILATFIRTRVAVHAEVRRARSAAATALPGIAPSPAPARFADRYRC